MSRGTLVYTAGVFDAFHVGHLNLLKTAKGLGDRLIAAVSTDEVVEAYKPNRLLIPFEHRAAIVGAVSYVDVCVPQHNRDKFEAWRQYKYDILAVGDDWMGTPEFVDYERRLGEVGATVVYIPYTPNISSSILRKKVEVSA